MEPQRNAICCSCGHSHPITRHHKIPLSRGGRNVESNTVDLCRPCHERIHGVGSGCIHYPDLAAAANACAAHWEIVRLSWRGQVPWKAAVLSRFGSQLLSAWDELRHVPPAAMSPVVDGRDFDGGKS